MLKHILFVALLIPVMVRADIAVVVNINSSIEALSLVEIKRMYRAKMFRFPGGIPIHLSYQPASQELAQQFNDLVVGWTKAKISRAWATNMFSGKMPPPIVLDNDQEVIEWIIENKNGIGYLDNKNLTDQVKKVGTIKN